MSLIIPIQPLPNQTFFVSVNNQNCTINIFSKWTGLFFSLSVDNSPVVSSRIIRNKLPIVNLAYNGFIGDFYMLDTQSNDDPIYTGLGSRWVLVYG